MTRDKLSWNHGLVKLIFCGTVLSLWTSPQSVGAQEARAGTALPSTAIALAELKAESDSPRNSLDLRRSLQGGLSQLVEQDLNASQSFREIYSLRLRHQQAIQIDLTSNEFDALLRIYDENGQLVAENDDWGGNTNSRLFLAALNKGSDRFFLVATAAQPRKGDFELRFRERESPNSAQLKPISIGQTVSGRLKPTSALNLEKQVVYDTYTFEGAAGDVVKLVATPTDAPVSLELRHGQDNPFRAGTTLPGRPVSIYGTLKGTGRYDVTVSGSPTATAAYQLEFTRLGEATVNADPTVVSVGQGYSHQFTPASPVYPGTDRPFILYRYDGLAGDGINAIIENANSTVQQRGYSPISVDIGVDSPVGFATVGPPLRLTRTSTSATFERNGFVFIRVLGPPAATTSFTLKIEPKKQSGLKAE